MTAIACLRILIDPDKAAAGGDTLAALVSKVADAFLESRWCWPRRHGPIAPYAFLLADPRATELDALELTTLSDELQKKLFGDSEAGAICLAMLEGEQEMVTRFATIDPAELRRVLAEGGTIQGVTGRMTEITPQGARVVSPPDQAGLLTTVGNSPSGTRRAASRRRHRSRLPGCLVHAEGVLRRQWPDRPPQNRPRLLQHHRRTGREAARRPHHGLRHHLPEGRAPSAHRLPGTSVPADQLLLDGSTVHTRKLYRGPGSPAASGPAKAGGGGL